MTKKDMIGIAIDPWKEHTFLRILNRAGYTPKVTRDRIKKIVMLKIETDDLPRLAKIVKKCNKATRGETN